MSVIRVAGCDPSLNNTGLVKGDLDTETGIFTLVDLLLIETSKAEGKSVRVNSSDLQRAQQLAVGISSFIKDCVLVFVEVPSGSQSARGAAAYGICIGLLGSLNTPLIQVTPTEVKLSLTNKKTASKKDMIDAAYSIYPDAPWLYRKSKGTQVLVDKNEHLADSIGAVHAGVNTDQFKQLVAILKR